MKQHQSEFTISTRGQGLYEFTDKARAVVREAKITTGVLTVYCRHTSASLVIQENADPDVLRDLKAFFLRLVPAGDPLYIHTIEGHDDMPAHVKSALTQTCLSIPIAGGKPAFGTWQGLFLFEHRDHPHHRNLILHVIGD